jgi:allophanate hydrolase
MRLDITALHAAYASGVKPADVISAVYDRVESQPLAPVWISLVPRETALARARALASLALGASGASGDRTKLPLYGVPFAVKDNIDVAGLETTAGCPAYAYRAQKSATVVDRLEAAGAILIGKTNMDQFATGLVGVRSPYGACSSVFDSRYISGGSSSGSAVAVASGLVTFALGTDTAGSGRVPAAFNNIVGLKPTRGSLSAAGIVPACRSLDCVSIFALTCEDARLVNAAARGFDAADPYSRATVAASSPWLDAHPVRLGVPGQDQLEFFGDDAAESLFTEAVDAAERTGARIVEFDYAPFKGVADLLYSGPWVAERLAALRDFFDRHSEDAHPIVRAIIVGAGKYSAVDSFLAQYKLEELRRVANEVWQSVDVLLLPTTGTIYTIEEVNADPVRLNTNLGFYTNFVNLLDLAALAVPAGFRPADARKPGLSFGVTLMAPAFSDDALLSLGDQLHRAIATSASVGATATPIAETAPITVRMPSGCVDVAVVGAHLTGQPLNSQLIERGARLIKTTETSGHYRLYALAGTKPLKPGMICEPAFKGPGIEVEVWSMPVNRFGDFVALIPPPLGIGSIELADGSTVKGFLCEPYALQDATEITHLGAWRRYLTSLPSN